MTTKFDWRRLLINVGLSLLGHLVDEVSTVLQTPPKGPVLPIPTVDDLDPVGWPKDRPDDPSSLQSRL